MTLIKLILSSITALCLTVSLTAQNFSGSDDFSSDSGNWSPDTPSGTASPDFAISGGKLNFTTDSPAGSGDNSVYRTWMANTGSYTNDWSIYADFDITATFANPDQSFITSISVLNSADTTDAFSVSLVWNNAASVGASSPVVTVTDGTNGGSTQIGGPLAITGTVAALGIVYDSATQTFIAGFDADAAAGGYIFTAITSFDMNVWGMTSSDNFIALLHSNNSTGALGGNAVTTGQATVDNFTAVPYSVAAVPEPSTYAFTLGMVGLGFVLLRRRTS